MTIRHVVSWKLAATDEAVKAEQAARIRDGLLSLRPLISDIRSLEVGINVLSPGQNHDVVLVADYDDEDALARYVAHPEHEKVVAYIRSVIAERTAVDYVLEADSAR
jgi:quinol monooxygenase YgiN